MTMEVSTPFTRLISLSREVFKSQQFSAAYHALTAAMHCAIEARTEQDLLLVEQMATEQLAYIDRYYPAYQHSTRSAEERGQTSIYAVLARQSKVRERIMYHQRIGWECRLPL